MSHPGMTAVQAAQYRVLDADELSRIENERKIEQLRRIRRATQLREEYRYLKDFKVQLVHPQSHDVNLSFTLEELFDMFTLTQEWRDYPL
jgi:hypothetical protein